MKKSELRQIIKEQILKERIVYKTAEFEEIDSAIQTIIDNVFVFRNPQIESKIISMLNQIEKLVNEFGTEEK